MLVKILMKIWPALTPILMYILWQYVLKKIVNKIYNTKKNSANQHNFHTDSSGKIIDAEVVEVGGKKTENANESKVENAKIMQNIFSFHNKNFIIVLYISLVIAIFCIISFAF